VTLSLVQQTIKIIDVWIPHPLSPKLMSETGKVENIQSSCCSNKNIFISFGTASHIHPSRRALYILNFGLASEAKKNPNMINFLYDNLHGQFAAYPPPGFFVR
jgi:hypothetical protein